MIDTTITLIGSPTRTQDENGVWRTSAQRITEVFARVDSVGRNEFYAAGQAGFSPEYRFTVFAGEYRGESACDYDGRRYAIYRTYHVPGTDYMELYVQREAGVHNGT